MIKRNKSRTSHKAIFANTVLAATLAYFLGLLITGHSHYLISLAGAALFAIALYVREEWKVNIALVVLPIGLSVAAAEFYLALRFSGPKTMQEAAALRNAAALRLGIPFDHRSKYEVLMALREQGIKAYPYIPTAMFASGEVGGSEHIVPLAGMSRRTTVYCNESGEYVIYESDEHGFNNPQGMYSLGDVGVILVGDSFAEGACVPPEENLAGQLRKLGHKVLNLGRGGIGPLHQLALLTEYAAPVQPRVVLWLYYEGNDLTDLERESSWPLLRRYLSEGFSQKLINRQRELDALFESHVEEMIRKEEQRQESIRHRMKSSTFSGRVLAEASAKVEAFLQLYYLRLIFQSLFLPSPLFRTTLTKAMERVTGWGGQLVFVYLPEWKPDDHKTGSALINHRQAVLSVVKSLGIPLIDFNEILAAYPDPLALFPLRMYGHYKPEGYRLLALRIHEYLRLRGLDDDRKPMFAA